MQARRKQLALALALALPGLAVAGPISDDVVKIGILTDMSGVYAGVGGKGSVIAAEMAIADFGGKVAGKPIQVVSADHQNKADIGAGKAREWFDTQGVDMINDLLNSGVGIAVQKLGAEKKRITINNGAGSTALTGKECSPYGIHYAYDTYALAKGTATALMKQGMDSWYFLQADYAFGQALQGDAAKIVQALGGKVAGTVKHPLSSTDFSSYLLQAQSSGAKVVGLANAGGDFVNAVKQAKEFGLKQTIVGLLVFDSDVKALGLNAAQGMKFTTAYSWELNPEMEAFGKKFFAKAGFMPTMDHAGVYSSTMHYLNAIKATGTDDADAVMKKMRETPVNDFFAKKGVIREDGRFVHDMYLVEVLKPSESKGQWDQLKLVATIPGEQAFKPLSASECALVKK
ncbi:ABC transporter substrate-binding protein [Chitinimonas taiwanensis]|uniref:Amino acid/amide ABC transporter substrate-binding protein, HAAT family (TC 3.A.1.4.-) n=1 Tax=Chitinimonas taiwanensis DSM 18899 TaxID=1121279 RepID=A0A1K2H8U8_9NEIS|nr:ABC transporter substrate-binding protein [Chitinimonas taiwanensis]SFZ73276.1 amino acid/amide ABC transporter substrate-binding protein, HAAT family (TC 3.A.1.4.-) [Chitinimonas taiwanensis DSM 18899]